MQFLSNNFKMSNLGEALFILGIGIQIEIDLIILDLSQKLYMDQVLKRFNINNCSPDEAPNC